MLGCSAGVGQQMTDAACTMIAGPWRGDTVIYVGDYWADGLFDDDRSCRLFAKFDGYPYEDILNRFENVTGRFEEARGHEYSDYLHSEERGGRWCCDLVEMVDDAPGEGYRDVTEEASASWLLGLMIMAGDGEVGRVLASDEFHAALAARGFGDELADGVEIPGARNVLASLLEVNPAGASSSATRIGEAAGKSR